MADASSSNDSAPSPSQWEELLDRLPVSSPEDVRTQIQAFQRVKDTLGADTPDDAVEAVSELQNRVETLEDQQAALREAGFDLPEYALDAIDSMEKQLDELYNEKEATEQTNKEDLEQNADTFDQLQALLAREEKLQRQLGFSNPDDIIEMVADLTEQLEDVYQDRDEELSLDSIFSGTSPQPPAPPPQPDLPPVLEEKFGVSDPDAAAAMMEDLTEQLEELYSGRKRLTEFNLNGADDAIKMVENMQQQLETLYEQREQMSEHGIEGMNHALSMIESMEAQLNELQDPPPPSDQTELEPPAQQLEALTEEKEQLREKRDQLQERLNALTNELGTQDPDAVSELVRSMEEQLEDIYETRQRSDTSSPAEAAPLLDDDTLARLDNMEGAALNDLPVGLFQLDEQGVVQNANEKALRWPDVTADTPDALLGNSFFDDIAPAANNALFQDRLETKRKDAALNEPFLYTYVGKQSPVTNLAVHLYSAPDQSTDWIVFEIREQY